jgi:uncharacterized SAM-binding protein YcdF (DUF218 family)
MYQIFRWNRQWKRRLRCWLALLIAIITCSESADWIACNVATNPPYVQSCQVLVLGYPSEQDGKPSPTQAARVAAGVRAYRDYNCDRLVVSGAAVKNQIVEAQTMARLARDSGISTTAIILETQARNTWENIKFSIPILVKSTDVDSTRKHQIAIVSDSLHAQRGRRYLCKQRPDLCAQTFVAVKYQPFERWWWKVSSGCYELFTWGRDLVMFS